MTSLKLRQFNHSKLQELISLQKRVKKSIKLRRRFFLCKINKNMQKKSWGEMFCKFVGMTSLMLNSKLKTLASGPL